MDPTPSTPELEHGKKQRRGLFRRQHTDSAELPRIGGGGGGGYGSGEDTVGSVSPPPESRAGSKIGQKRAARKEKKERQLERKDMKRNPQFDFIEADQPAATTKKNLQEKKKQDQDLFNFTDDNKHLRGYPPVTRQMVRAVKHPARHDPLPQSEPGASAPPSAGAGEAGSGDEADARRSGSGGAASGTATASSPVLVAVPNKLGLSAGDLQPLVPAATGATKAGLEDFLLSHPMHRLLGTTWSYMYIRRVPAAGGRARESMVVLTGGGVRPEVFFELFAALLEDFDVLAPVIPGELATVEDYVAGLELLRRHLRLSSFHLFGLCFCGSVALHYASLYPARVRSLTLSHTPPPCVDFGRLAARYSARIVESGKSKLQDVALPSALARLLFGFNVTSKDLARDMPELLTPDGGKRLVVWKGLMRKFALPASGIVSKLNALAKYHVEVTYTPASFAQLRCPVLLMDTERRDAFGVRAFDELKALFPAATVDFSEGCGHLVLAVKGHDVGTAVLRWLSKEYWPHATAEAAASAATVNNSKAPSGGGGGEEIADML